MKRFWNYLTVLFAFLSACLPLLSLSKEQTDKGNPVVIIVEWKQNATKGKIEVLNGLFAKLKILDGKGKVLNNAFYPSSAGRFRLEISLSANLSKTELPTLVRVGTDKKPFSFFIRDVSKGSPIFLKDLAVVLPSGDLRDYKSIEQSVGVKNWLTSIQTIEGLPEENFELAATGTVVQPSPTLLGVSRDFRIFHLDERTRGLAANCNYTITPMLSGQALSFPTLNITNVAYAYAYGRGLGAHPNLKRTNEDGIYPIRHSIMNDEGVEYHATSFVSLEYSVLKKGNINGTHYLVADKYGVGSMHTKTQQKLFGSLKETELSKNEETVFYHQVKVTNKANVPKYAWFKTIKPGAAWYVRQPYNFEKTTGYSSYTADSVFAVSKQDGRPLSREEVTVMLQPGETTVFEFYLPHAPVSLDRAKKLAFQDFEKRKNECKLFWQGKLEQGAQIQVPEARVNEMIKAGLLHLDLITFGKEPNGTLAPSIGKYSPIGTESSPIIQFYATMGWFEIAKRSVNFFLDKQHENGFIQNFGGYMVETGAALYTMGEYMRYSNDLTWLMHNKARILKSCDYLIKWRKESKKEELRGKGYGMIAGKVADPEDHFPQYMLNGYGYIGLKRMAEVFLEIDRPVALMLQKEADEWKTDIRASFFHSCAHSPLLPLNDGSWVSSAPPWAGGNGLRTFNLEHQNYWSHGTFTVQDGLLGPLHLVFCEVLDAEEPEASDMLNYHADVLFQQNSSFSQPYYSRQDWMQARLGLVKPFLKNYYDSMAALADRETYTFWEHVFGASPHKTHEEAWFLMQTRWMLYMEEGDHLNLLKTIPRDWMEDGKEIILKDVQTYFGKIKLVTKSNVGKGYIEAFIACNDVKKPRIVNVRLPHPQNRKPIKVTGGVYDPLTETVTLNLSSGSGSVRVEF